MILSKKITIFEKSLIHIYNYISDTLQSCWNRSRTLKGHGYFRHSWLNTKQHYSNLRNFLLTCRESGIDRDIINYYHALPENCYPLNWIGKEFSEDTCKTLLVKKISMWTIRILIVGYDINFILTSYCDLIIGHDHLPWYCKRPSFLIDMRTNTVHLSWRKNTLIVTRNSFFIHTYIS